MSLRLCSPYILTTPCTSLLRAWNAPSTGNGPVGLWGLGACVQPHVAMQGYATMTRPFFGNNPIGHPLGQSRHSPSTWPHTSMDQTGVQKMSRGFMIHQLSSANISISHALYKHNKAEKLSVSPLSHVTGSSGSEPTLLSQQVRRRHHLLVMHLFLRSKRQWRLAHRPKPVICLA